MSNQDKLVIFTIVVLATLLLIWATLLMGLRSDAFSPLRELAYKRCGLKNVVMKGWSVENEELIAKFVCN